MRFDRITRAGFLPALVLLAAGCTKPSGSVNGEVTVDGKALPNGYITFTPSDGKGPIAGGPVTDGKFDVPAVPTGPKTVTVQATLPTASSEKELSSADAYAKGAKVATAPPIQEAVGNAQSLDVAAGPQTFKMTLTTVKR